METRIGKYPILHSSSVHAGSHVRRCFVRTPAQRFLAAFAGLVLMSASALAAWPERPVHIVLGYGAGGGADQLARLISAELATRLEQGFVVENVVGANGDIAAQTVARSRPDGYKLLFIVNGHVLKSAKEMKYDPITDFTPIIQVATIPNVIVVSPKLGVRSLAELEALLKKNPGKYNFASNGVGSTIQLGTELYRRAAGVDMLHVPYKGAGQAITSVAAGETQFYLSAISTARPLLAGGQVQALAVTSEKRVPSLPDVPTTAEAGLPAFRVATWYGVLGPAGLAPSIVDTLNREIANIVRTPQFQAKLESEGGVGAAGSAAEFGRLMEDEGRRMAPLYQSIMSKER